MELGLELTCLVAKGGQNDHGGAGRSRSEEPPHSGEGPHLAFGAIDRDPDESRYRDHDHDCHHDCNQ